LTGTVTIIEKNPAETVLVELYIWGDSWTYALPDPGSFIFHQLGTQSFNLTVFLKEDAPPGDIYQVSIRAYASSTLDSGDDIRLLSVIPTWSLASEATLMEEPKDVSPGGAATGIVEILNTGSRYADYFLVVAEDPDGVVALVELHQPVELAPNLLEKARFDIEVDPSASPGEHRVVIGLMTRLDAEETQSLDTFEVVISVVEPEDVTGPGILLMGVLVVVGLMAVAILLRRKA
jgi:uncharacterized membrane protein